jgi:hypothetical protein
MYTPKILVEQVIKLFTEQEEYRDDRYLTIQYIVDKYYKKEYGKSIILDYKLMSDIDRAFRYIQQYHPKLRGKTWLKRQRQAGEISKEDYIRLTEHELELETIVKQLKLF